MRKSSGVLKSKKGRILFIEDERNLVDLYHSYFEGKGYDFLSTKDIEEAEKLTEFEQPDVILLDLILPKEEEGIIKTDAEQGYEFLTLAKRNPKIKNIPIVVFTSLNTDYDRKKCADLGAIAYLFKGRATPQEVLKTVDKMIQRTKK